MKYQKLVYILLSFLVLAAFLTPCAVWAQNPKTDLQLTVTGGFPGSVKAGQETHFFLTLKNNGDATLNDIGFSHDAPAEISINFQPGTISSLGAGSITTVDVNIGVARNSGNRDYAINLIANSLQTRAVVPIYFRVEGGASYLTWVGLGMGLIVILAFILVYRRFSK